MAFGTGTAIAESKQAVGLLCRFVFARYSVVIYDMSSQYPS